MRRGCILSKLRRLSYYPVLQDIHSTPFDTNFSASKLRYIPGLRNGVIKLTVHKTLCRHDTSSPRLLRHSLVEVRRRYTAATTCILPSLRSLVFYLAQKLFQRRSSFEQNPAVIFSDRIGEMIKVCIPTEQASSISRRLVPPRSTEVAKQSTLILSTGRICRSRSGDSLRRSTFILKERDDIRVWHWSCHTIARFR